MSKAMKAVDPLDNQDTFRHYDDFFYFNDAEMWTLTKDAAAGIVDSDAHGGVLIFTTAATNNNEAYLGTTQAVALPIADKPVSCRARLQFSEASAQTANIIFGFSSTSAANTLQDDGAGPPASYSGAVFFKVDQLLTDGTNWWVESSNGSTQTTTKTNSVAPGAGYQDLEVNIDPINSTTAQVTFRINGQQCRDMNGDVIVHTLTLTSLAAMKVIVGEKTGAAADLTLNVDCMAFGGKR